MTARRRPVGHAAPVRHSRAHRLQMTAMPVDKRTFSYCATPNMQHGTRGQTLHSGRPDGMQNGGVTVTLGSTPDSRRHTRAPRAGPFLPLHHDGRLFRVNPGGRANKALKWGARHVLSRHIPGNHHYQHGGRERGWGGGGIKKWFCGSGV